MRELAIIGAGELGGALAYRLAARDLAATIRLIDETPRVAEGKALDIAQAAPLGSFAASVSGSSDLDAASGAAIVVIADRLRGGEWTGDEGMAALRRVCQVAPGAIIVCAGAAQRDIVERGARELKIDPRRIVGSAPEALVGAARAIVALESNRSTRDVALMIAGNPPGTIVLSWEDASIGGVSAVRVLDETARRRIAARLPALWPPGPYALAAASSKVVGAIAERSRQVACCYVAADDRFGSRARTAALPVRFDDRGVAEVMVPPLNAHDRVALENAILL